MQSSTSQSSQYRLTDNGTFVIDDYNCAKPFSSFFPGIAGIDGVPMWAFYVNRGQCICSMGTQDKDHAIMEFLPANRAYNLVTRQGFRTFLKFINGPVQYYEPFGRHYRDDHLDRSQRMIISPWGLKLEEENRSLNLRFTVTYYTVPRDCYAGLVRVLQIENIGSDHISIEALDGLPEIVPYGVDNFSLKNMKRTIEAFIEVNNTEHNVPFFRGKVEPADRPDVRIIQRGNFYVGFELTESKSVPVRPIVDPTRIFGSRLDYSYPERFLQLSSDEIVKDQLTANQFPCAMGVCATTLEPGAVYRFASIIGHASSLDTLNSMIPRIATREYVERKAQINRETIERLTQCSLLNSSKPSLNHYAGQNFLDNAMRGGFPITLKGETKHRTLYLYSRKHGDLERDYNDFRLMPTYYSQGNGNFRDINQNRRSDLFINPKIGSRNVRYFYNLIQLDGFNPLVLKQVTFVVVDNDAVDRVIKEHIDQKHQAVATAHVAESFTPGSLLTELAESDGAPADSEVFIGKLLEHCESVAETDHGEGFWSDHWTYNLDLLENFKAVFPDRFDEILFERRDFTFYNNAHRVQPRNQRYVLWDGKPMQLGSVVFDEEKAAMIAAMEYDGDKVRTEHGRGDVYHTNLVVKILSLIVNKLSSLDPNGVGVEMEAGKPNWYDALNGLPGLFGSSINETLEVKRHVKFLLDAFAESIAAPNEVPVYEELSEFMDTVDELLDGDIDEFEFWNAASTAREQYREATRLGVSGKEVSVSVDTIRSFLTAGLKKLDAGIEKSRDPESGALFTYFRHEAADYRVTDDHSTERRETGDDGDALPRISVSSFKQKPLPLFLEGQVHYLRCLDNREEARQFADQVRRSQLYDSKLNMYKVNAPLADQPLEIGRARVFSPGWLENESVWLHMEYKYLLELLSSELYEEFFEALTSACIPFLDAETYGRSTLENSSFIVSSAHPNSAVHGNGFVARLSGATAEFIQMLYLMTLGPRPFQLNEKRSLELSFQPSLPAWLFTDKVSTVELYRDDRRQNIELPENSLSFMFLGSILVTYHNKGKKDTFGPDAVRPVEWKLTDLAGQPATFSGDVLSGDPAHRVRSRQVSRIDVTLG